MFSDFRQAMRALRRVPGFTLTVALTLALGIGAVTTLTSVLDLLLFRPPVGVEAPGRVVRLYFHHRSPQFGEWLNAAVSYPDYTDLAAAKGFTSIAASYSSSASLGRGAEAAPVTLAGVTGSYFPMLGTKPLLGRLLSASDEAPASGPPVAVLSERLWQSRFGGAADVVGRTLALDDKIFTVIGVAPKHFDGGDYEAADLWAPLGTIAGRIAGESYRTDRGWYWVHLVARLAPGVSLTQAADEATALVRAGRSDSTVSNGFRNVELGPVLSAAGPNYRSTADLARWLAAMSVLVLLIASANVANLMLTRGLTRARELAVRKALGAGQGRLVWQLFLEGLLTAVLGGGFGVLAAAWGVGLLRGFVLPPTMAERFAIDGRVLFIALAATGIAALVSSLVPSIQVTRGDLTPVLKEGGRGSGFRRSRLRSGLVVGQVALSVLLVVGAGLFFRSLRNVLAIDVGYDRAHVLMVTVDPASAGFTGLATGQAFETLASAARAHPAVASVSLNNGEPFGWSMAQRLRIAGRDSLPRLSSGGPYIQRTTADYFRTMGLAVVRGHGFTDADRREQPLVALIGATMAKRFFPGQDPIGQCLLIGPDKPPCTQIIGVVQDGVRYTPQEEPQAVYYLPLAPPSESSRHLTMFVRTHGPAAAALEEIRRVLQSAVPELPYLKASSLEELLEPAYRDFRLGASLFGLYALTALLLAGVGLYSVLSYAVRGRTQELGIRLALGAAPRALVRLIVHDGVRLVGIGLTLGLLAALATGGALRALLYGVAPTDPVTIGVSAVVMLGTAVIASLLPARRAAKVDPMKALRSE